MINFIQIRPNIIMSLFCNEYIFVDLPEHLSYGIFAKKGIKFKKLRELCHPNTEYHLIACRLSKKQGELFVQCMEELINKMILTGHADYEESCEKIFNFDI